MSPVYIQPIELTDLDGIYSEALNSTFWQTCDEPGVDSGSTELSSGLISARNGAEGASEGSQTPSDTRFEKESWLNAVTLTWGLCGFSLRRTNQHTPIATLLFAPPGFTPRARCLPTAPVSSDAILLASLHYAPFEVTESNQRALIDVALSHLKNRGIKAVEAFGCSGNIDQMEEGTLPENLTLTEQVIDSLDLKNAAHACTADKMSDVAHGPGDLISTKVLIEAGFTVVRPHPTHPRLRKNLTPNLDWSEAMGSALDRQVALQSAMGKKNYEFFSASRS